MDIYYASIVISCISLLILVTFIANNDLIKKDIKKYFIVGSMLVCFASLCECWGMMLNGTTGILKVLHSIIKFLELSITPCITFILSMAFRQTKSRKKLMIVFFAHILIQFSSLFLKTTFYIDCDGMYHHSTFYFVYYVVLVIGLSYLIYSVLKFNVDYQNSKRFSILAIIFLLLIGTVWQAVNKEIKVVWMTTTISIILFFIYYFDMLLKIDELTNLLNRRTFDNKLENLKSKSILLVFDIDNFKSVNDVNGHQFGDKTLKIVANSLKKIYGKCGNCYRIGGDEFCVILTKRLEEVEVLNLEFTNDLFKERIKENKLSTVAIGYAYFDPLTMNVKEKFNEADMKMYEEKNKAKL